MITVLVVDDSPTQRARWIYSLSGANTTVVSEDQPVPPRSGGTNVIKLVTAKNGEHALARLRTMDIKVLITDVEMPGINGWQLALAAQGLKRDLIVVVFGAKVNTGQNPIPELDPLRTHVISKDDREQAVDVVRRLLGTAG